MSSAISKSCHYLLLVAAYCLAQTLWFIFILGQLSFSFVLFKLSNIPYNAQKPTEVKFNQRWNKPQKTCICCITPYHWLNIIFYKHFFWMHVRLQHVVYPALIRFCDGQMNSSQLCHWVVNVKEIYVILDSLAYVFRLTFQVHTTVLKNSNWCFLDVQF